MKKMIIFLALMFFVIGCTNQTKISSNLSAEEIRQIALKLDEINQNKINQYEYPKIVGVDERNGQLLELRYMCMDLCPQYGSVNLVYKNITTKTECNAINGTIVNSGMPMPGEFYYCAPKINEIKNNKS